MNLFKWGQSIVQKFNIWDIAVFKIYLFFLGAIAGAYYADFVIKYIWDFALVTIASLFWLFYKIFTLKDPKS